MIIYLILLQKMQIVVEKKKTHNPTRQRSQSYFDIFPYSPLFNAAKYSFISNITDFPHVF